MPAGCGIGLGFDSVVFASQSGGSGFDWDPEGVIFGIDFQTDRIFDGETTTDDYSTVLAGAFDVGEVSSRGMRIDGQNGNLPDAFGPLLTLLATKNYTVLFFWERDENDTALVNLLTLVDDGDSVAMDVQYDTDSSHATDPMGASNDVGLTRSFSDNVMAVVPNDAGGVLASLNGATAVSSESEITDTIDSASIGHRQGGNMIAGWIKAIIFYEATNAAGVETYSTNPAPVNTVLPVMSGFQEADGTLTVSTGTWTGGATSYLYQWRSDAVNLDGETANSLVLADGLHSTVIDCVVRAVSDEGITGVLVSNPIPVSEVEPEITGTTEVGEDLAVSNGTWAGGAAAPTSYEYQWYDSIEALAGATASTYTLQAGDDGETISAEVIGINAHGQALASAAAVGPITA